MLNLFILHSQPLIYLNLITSKNYIFSAPFILFIIEIGVITGIACLCMRNASSLAWSAGEGCGMPRLMSGADG